MSSTRTQPVPVPVPGDPMHPDTVRVYPLDFPATMSALLRRAVDLYGDRDLVVTAERRLTFAEIERASRALAARLVEAGVTKGTRVGMLFPQGAEWIVAFLGTVRAGAVAVPFSTFYAPGELRRALVHGDVQHLLLPATLFGRDMAAFAEQALPELGRATGPVLFLPEVPYLRSVWLDGGNDRAWVTAFDSMSPAATGGAVDGDFVDRVEEQISPADLLVTIYTSGTTSEPKGVVHTHGTQVRHGVHMARHRALSADDVTFAAAPFFWIGGFTCTFMAALYSGSALLCQERFEAGAALDLIEREQPTKYFGWATVLPHLVNHPSYPDRNLAGVPFLPPPGAPPVDRGLRHLSLGMTETSGPHTGVGPAEGRQVLPERLRGSFGARLPYVEHRIADPATNATLVDDDQEGEVCIRGYSVMAGLHKREREEAFDADGWYHTGDRGFWRDGYLIFTGRATEMIKTAGSNVAPREVEVALETFPEVKFALVFGLPDSRRGEIVVAGVVPAPGAGIDVEELRERARSQLSNYKIPRTIVVLGDDEVPALGSGKPDRRAVKAILHARLEPA